VVRRRVRDQQQRLAFPLHFVIDRQSLYFDLRHALLLLAAVNTPSDCKIIASIGSPGNFRLAVNDIDQVVAARSP
jgi:hypothetical protein